jgi:hypothetical protein
VDLEVTRSESRKTSIIPDLSENKNYFVVGLYLKSSKILSMDSKLYDSLTIRYRGVEKPLERLVISFWTRCRSFGLIGATHTTAIFSAEVLAC